MSKQIISQYLIEYLDKKKIKYKKFGQIKMLKCVFCEKEPISANIIPNTNKIHCLNQDCKKKTYNFIEMVGKLENLTDENEILQHIKDLLKIKVTTENEKKDIDKVLDFYEQNKFNLIPIVRNTKSPIETGWNKTEHKNKKDWKTWIENGNNIGFNTGIIGNKTVIDIDALTKSEKEEIRKGKLSDERYKELMKKREEGLKSTYKSLGEIGNPVIQSSLGGHHLIYQFEKDIPKTFIELEGIHLDIENEGGYILTYPSKLGNGTRKFKSLHKIEQMPESLKKLILSKTVHKQDKSDNLEEHIKNEDFKINPGELELKNNNLEGCCNNAFIQLGGVLRKKLNIDETKYVLHVLNKHLLANPMDSKSINSMVRELSKYNIFDEEDLACKVVEYLKNVENVRSINDISNTIVATNRGEDKLRIEKVIKYLEKEERIIKVGKNSYQTPKELNWTGKFMQRGRRVNFKVPYFHDYAYFNFGDIIILGSANKWGKSTLAMNFVKRLVDQSIQPYYIYSESGSRFIRTGLSLGMKEDDYLFPDKPYTNPYDIILRKNSVTIYDWVRPLDFAKTDELFNWLVQQTEKIQGFLICFVQLKDDNTFFAPNLIGQFPAMLVKYLWRDADGEKTYFDVNLIREKKLRMQKLQIDSIYNDNTKEVKLLEELNVNKEKENK